MNEMQKSISYLKGYLDGGGTAQDAVGLLDAQAGDRPEITHDNLEVIGTFFNDVRKAWEARRTQDA